MKTLSAEDFWKWFEGEASAIADAPLDPVTISNIDRRIHELDVGLSWEIGPGQEASMQLVISPNLDNQLLLKARMIADKAPQVPGWEFHATRPPKVWNGQSTIVLEDHGPADINCAAWEYVLLRYEDDYHELLLLPIPPLPPLSENEKWEVATTVLESILGEEKLMKFNGEYLMVTKLESSLAKQAKPIRNLSEAFK